MNRLTMAAVLIISSAQSAMAADPAAQVVTKLFLDICVPNMGRPAQVREWAQAHQLVQIVSPAALGVFAGPGTNGAAWVIPSTQGSFALSLRGTTQACAVWARSADPNEVLANFKTVMEGIRRPGINVSMNKDETSPSPSGAAHMLVYSVGAPGTMSLFLFTLLTAEHPGGAFQASLQVAQASSQPGK